MSAQANRPTEAGIGKAQYRVMNWPAYDRALVQRGSLTSWFDEGFLRERWRPAPTGQRRTWRKVHLAFDADVEADHPRTQALAEIAHQGLSEWKKIDRLSSPQSRRKWHLPLQTTGWRSPGLPSVRNPGDGGACASGRLEYHDLPRHTRFHSSRGYFVLSKRGSGEIQPSVYLCTNAHHTLLLVDQQKRQLGG